MQAEEEERKKKEEGKRKKEEGKGNKKEGIRRAEQASHLHSDRPSSLFLFPSSLLSPLPGILFLLPRLLYPMQMDQYFHHYLGWRLLHGGLPYIASFDQNFLGGAVLYALGILTFGHSSLGFAVYDVIVQAFACYLIARLAHRFDASGVAAWIAPAIYTLTYIGLGAWDVGQRDSFLAPMLALLLLLLTTDKKLQWFVSGLLVGAMALTRPFFAIASILIFIAWYARHERMRSLLHAAIGCLLLPIATVLLYALIGHLHELYDATIAFNLEVYSKFRHGVNFRGSGTMTVVLVVGIVLYLRSLPFRSFQKLQGPLLLLCAFAIAPLSTWLQGQGDPHHTTPSYAIAALLAGIGYAWLIGKARERNATLGAVIAVVIALCILWRGIDRIPGTLMAMWVRDTPLQSIYEEQDRGDVKLEEEFAAATYIRSHTAPADPIYIFSMRIWPYELADRLPPTRFQSPEHLIMQPADQPLTRVQKEWRAEFMSDMRRTPPKYILITTTDQMWLYPHAEASIDQVKRFPEFAALLSSRYALDTVIGAFRIYGDHAK